MFLLSTEESTQISFSISNLGDVWWGDTFQADFQGLHFGDSFTSSLEGSSSYSSYYYCSLASSSILSLISDSDYTSCFYTDCFYVLFLGDTFFGDFEGLFLTDQGFSSIDSDLARPVTILSSHLSWDSLSCINVEGSISSFYSSKITCSDSISSYYS